jgi:hypothetical protein
MRTNLIKESENRKKFFAKVEKFGTKNNYHGYPQRTVLFTDVRFEDGTLATDHIWMTVGKRIDSITLNSGDLVSFHARVSKYKKGYYKNQIDYALKNITKLQKETQED